MFMHSRVVIFVGTMLGQYA